MKQKLKIFIGGIRNYLSVQFKKYDEKWPYLILIVVALVVVIGGINLFVELTDTLHTETLAKYDEQITDFFISRRNPKLTDYFLFVTHVGDVYGYLVVLALTILVSTVVFKRWRYVGQVVLVLFLASVSNMMLKRAIDRARPGIEHLVSVETLSYPSGHAMSAMAFYGFLIYLFYTFRMNKILKGLAVLFLIILILSIGISRIYLGVHFPSDVVGGFIAGLIWVFFCIFLFNIIEVFRRDPKT
ncbi:phosphatase PAP2 family protein [Costertonia aggregata]|uniref:Phosphatase PAP2 family protein n=1 Tax=Costertonia aggregata TaxID=343403 RepID=A0A7H9ATF9_9FLAO|nr:phosphatase PAP2 family protein [Costertonia aggregata]QLG46485.1 phosphatase PAP2 family protein [Costertonia aggregata]